MATEPTEDDDPLFDDDDPLLGDDPLLDEIVEASMADFADLVPFEVAEEIRSSIRGLFTFHPEAQRLLRQARTEAPVVDRSAKVARGHQGRRPG